MKIGILTAARTNNNGTDLQAFAMGRIFKEIVPTTEVINYVCDKLERSHLLLSAKGVKELMRLPWRIFNNFTHWQFRRKYVPFSKKKYDKDTISSIDYNAVVVGSDQIWNLKLTGGDINFFLPFQKEGLEKYSYAASLGKISVQEWEEMYALSKYLKEFSGVSVREDSGVSALEEIGIKARHDLDPLLLLPREEWEKTFPVKKCRKPYILIYTVEGNEEAILYAREYAKKKSVDIIWVSNGIKPYPGIKIKRFVSVEKWISYMQNAELILTNSYHGLSLAVNFERNFRLFPLKENQAGNTRMFSLLNMLNLSEYIYRKETPEPNDRIPWDAVHKLLEEKREFSKEYIKAIIKNVNKGV